MGTSFDLRVEGAKKATKTIRTHLVYRIVVNMGVQEK